MKEAFWESSGRDILECRSVATLPACVCNVISPCSYSLRVTMRRVVFHFLPSAWSLLCTLEFYLETVCQLTAAGEKASFE